MARGQQGAGGRKSKGGERGLWGSLKRSSEYAQFGPCRVCPVQWLQVGTVCLQPPGPEELPCSSESGRENLLHQAMQNSGIVLERVTGEEGALEPAPPAAPSPQALGDGTPELPLLEVEPVETVGACAAGVLQWGLDPSYRVTGSAQRLPPCCVPCGGKIEPLLQELCSLFTAFPGLMMEFVGPGRGGGCHGSVLLSTAGVPPTVGAGSVLWPPPTPSRWPVGPPLCPGPTRALSAVRPSRRQPPWKPTKGAMQVGVEVRNGGWQGVWHWQQMDLGCTVGG